MKHKLLIIGAGQYGMVAKEIAESVGGFEIIAFLDDKNEIINNSKIIDLGEIYICYDICLKNAKKYGNSFDREFCFLFIHGLLHLLGYDHQTKEQEEVMFKLQDEILPPKEN